MFLVPPKDPSVLPRACVQHLTDVTGPGPGSPHLAEPVVSWSQTLFCAEQGLKATHKCHPCWGPRDTLPDALGVPGERDKTPGGPRESSPTSTWAGTMTSRHRRQSPVLKPHSAHPSPGPRRSLAWTMSPLKPRDSPRPSCCASLGTTTLPQAARMTANARMVTTVILSLTFAQRGDTARERSAGSHQGLSSRQEATERGHKMGRRCLPPRSSSPCTGPGRTGDRRVRVRTGTGCQGAR